MTAASATTAATTAIVAATTSGDGGCSTGDLRDSVANQGDVETCNGDTNCDDCGYDHDCNRNDEWLWWL